MYELLNAHPFNSVVFFSMKDVKRWSSHIVIARRTTGRRGNPSCLGGRVRGCLFGYLLTVDRHGLRPRDDKGGIFTMKGVK